MADLPEDLNMEDVDPGDPLCSILLENGDMPMRTIAFVDGSDLGEWPHPRFTSYRTIATVEETEDSQKS